MSEPAKKSVLLRAQGLHKSYLMADHRLRVLRGVDLSVGAGQWLVVLGSSGSGKSTLLHLLGGLDRPDRGQVLFDRDNVFDLPAAQINRYRNRHIGFVFQFYHLLPELTALENVLISAMIGRGIFQWPGQRAALRKQAVELLDRLGVGERLDHRPAKLSGGERQRVTIARALMNQPAILLADEPTGNLDADTGRQILNVFADLHRRGQTIVMVSHDRHLADAADQTLTLSGGKLS